MNEKVQLLVALLSYRPVWQASVAVLTCWFLGYYGFSMYFALALTPVFFIWERTAVERLVRQKVQEYADLTEVRKERQVEPVTWINNMMATAWPAMGPYVSQLMMEKTQEPLNANKPALVDEFFLENVDMGIVPPQMHDVIVYRNEDKTLLDIEATIAFQSNITMELTAYTKAARVPIAVENPVFSCRARVKGWLIAEAPFLSKIQISFISKPKMDVNVRPISVGPDVINAVPFLSSSIRDMLIDMVCKDWVHPKYLEVVLSKEPGQEMKLQTEEKIDRSGGMMSSLSRAPTAMVGSVGSGIGAGMSAVGSVGGAAAGKCVNTTKAVGEGIASAGSAVTGGVGKVGGAVVGGVRGFVPGGKKKDKDKEKEKEKQKEDGHEDTEERPEKPERQTSKKGLMGSFNKLNPLGSSGKKESKKKEEHGDAEESEEVSDTSEEKKGSTPKKAPSSSTDSPKKDGFLTSSVSKGMGTVGKGVGSVGGLFGMKKKEKKEDVKASEEHEVAEPAPEAPEEEKKEKKHRHHRSKDTTEESDSTEKKHKSSKHKSSKHKHKDADAESATETPEKKHKKHRSKKDKDTTEESATNETE